MQKNKVIIIKIVHYRQTEKLSNRQREIMELICQGLDTNKIAKKLIIAPTTVNTHIDNILGIFFAKNRAEAVAKYLGYEKDK